MVVRIFASLTLHNDRVNIAVIRTVCNTSVVWGRLHSHGWHFLTCGATSITMEANITGAAFFNGLLTTLLLLLLVSSVASVML